MRLLALLQGREVEDQIGFHSAFQDMETDGSLSGYHAVAWRGFVEEQGWGRFCEQVLREARSFEPDAIYFQFFHVQQSAVLERFVESLRELPSRPVLAISGGDAFAWHSWLKNVFPPGFISVAREADVTFLTAMGKCADYLVRRKIRNIVLLPLGACQVRFRPAVDDLPERDPEFDVVFLGKHGRCRDPRSFLFYYARKRARLVKRLQARYGRRFGLFGRGWEGFSSWQGTVPYAEQLEACRRAAVVFGGAPGIYQDYYASDRPFIQAVSGVPLVDWHVPRTENLLRDGEHWYLVGDEEAMCREIDRLLDTGLGEARRKAAAAADYVHGRLTQAAMMRFLVRTLASCRSARLAGGSAEPPEFSMFLPEVDLETEQRYALRNWCG